MIVGIRKVVKNIFSGLSEATMIEILIVEDNAEFREMLKAILQSGFPDAGISVAEDGEAALSKIKLKKPDLVFMDIRMPGKSGIIIAGEIKERHPAMLSWPFSPTWTDRSTAMPLLRAVRIFFFPKNRSRRRTFRIWSGKSSHNTVISL
jgi:CheY-like chemotaxis protein